MPDLIRHPVFLFWIPANERRWFANERRWFATERRWFATERRWFATERRWFATERRWFAFAGMTGMVIFRLFTKPSSVTGVKEKPNKGR
jgi:hypothetical protein